MDRAYAAVFRRSVLTHRPKEVFAAAEQGPVLIEGTGKRNLVVETEALADHLRRVELEVARVLALESVAPVDVPKLPGFAWVESLPEEDRAAMVESLRAALRRAVETQSWDEYDLAWFGWFESARVLADEQLTARLLARSDSSLFVPLRRP